MIIDGKKIAQDIIDELKSQPVPKKILVAILVDENGSTSSPQVQASISFLKQKEKTAKELGVDFRLYKFGKNLKNDGLRKEIGRIAKQSRVGGVIVQLPLPDGINRRYVLNAIPPEKDVDVLSEKAQEAFRAGKSKVLPPAVGVVEEILSDTNIRMHANDTNDFLKDKRVAVVGLGFLVGKPISEWLKGNPSAGLRARCAELYLLDKGNDFSILKNADLVISGVGKAGLIKPETLKEGAAIIDFGYSMDESGKIRGDFDASKLGIGNWKLEIAWHTPTPGGTGPILVAKLFENFYKLNF